MKRKKNNNKNTVFQFGIPDNKMPKWLPSHIYEQFRLANDFWNELVIVHKEYQTEYQRIRDEADIRIMHIKEELEKLYDQKKDLQGQIKLKRQKARGGTDTAEINQQIKQIQTNIKSLRQAKKSIYQEAKEQIDPVLKEHDKQRQYAMNLKRKEYKDKGLYVDNYNATVKSYETARRNLLKLRSQGRSADLKKHRFRGEGRLSIQLRYGLSVSDIFSTNNNYIQIDPVPEETWTSTSRSERNKLKKTTARIRVKSEKAKPVWFEFPVSIHRKIPEDYRIKWVQLCRKKVGSDFKWSLNVTAEIPNQETETAQSNCESILALDIGWRTIGNSLRIAAWRDNHGNTGEVALDESFLRSLQKANDLSSIITTRFNDIKETILQHLTSDWPEWLQNDFKYIRLWKNPAKLMFIANKWKHNRFPGDETIYNQLSAWRKKHEHLDSYMKNLMNKVQGRRKEQYRIFAKWASDNYDMVILECFNLPSVGRKKAPEQGVDYGTAVRFRARLASPGQLRQEINRAFKKLDKPTQQVGAAGTSQECPFCLKKATDKSTQDLIITCQHCRAVYDRDHGATYNILLRGVKKNKLQLKHEIPKPEMVN